MGEGKDARVAGASVTYAAHTLPERGKGGPEARRDPPQGRGGAGAGRTPDQCGRGMASSLAEMAGIPGRDAPAGCTHPAGADPLGRGVPSLQALRFRPQPGKPVPHPGRRDPEGGGAAPEGRTTQRCHGGRPRQPSRQPPQWSDSRATHSRNPRTAVSPRILEGLWPGPSSSDRSQRDGDSTGAEMLTHGRA